MKKVLLSVLIMLSLSACYTANPDQAYMAGQEDAARNNTYLAHEQRRMGHETSAQILDDRAAENRSNIRKEMECNFFEIAISLIIQPDYCK